MSTPCPQPGSGRRYARHEPEHTVWYEVVRDHLGTALARARDDSSHGFGWPRFVQGEFDEFIRCGRLQFGFSRVVCRDCGHERLLAFACRGRAVCPSCTTRRMNDSAALLCDRVLPEVPYRAWVLSLPRQLRLRLARDAALLSAALRAFLQVVFAWQRRRARAAGVARPLTGAVTAVQFFGSALNLNVHFHSLLPDGVFAIADDGSVTWHELEPPTDREVAALIVKVARRILKRVAPPDPDADAPDDDEPDALAVAQADSVNVRVPPPRDDDAQPAPPSGRCAFLRGFSLHANVAIHENDRDGLERVCRYNARGPLSLARLERADDGQLLYHLKRPRKGGVRSLSLSPVDLIARVATLIPPPRLNLTRFHGVFAAHSKHRALVVPAPPEPPPPPPSPSPPPAPAPSPYRIPWADLLKRVFRIDVLRCERCGGRARVLACITDPPDVVRRILAHLGLPSTPPRAAPARASPGPGPEAPFDVDFPDAAFHDDPA